MYCINNGKSKDNQFIKQFINDENNTNYGVNKDTGANNPDTIKYDTRVLKQMSIF